MREDSRVKIKEVEILIVNRGLHCLSILLQGHKIVVYL